MRFSAARCGALGLFLLVQSALGQAPATTSAPATSAGRPVVRAVVREVKPFVFEQDGRLTGYSIDLWERIAADQGLRTEYVRVNTVGEMLDHLRKREADVGVGALTITSDRERFMDFTTPFYQSGLQIATGPRPSANRAAQLWQFAWETGAFTLLGAIVILLLVIAHVLWLVERRHNPEMFPSTYRAGVSEALWYCVSVIISGGCENKSPVGLRGRVVAVFFMLVGIGLVSYFTASITTLLTVQTLAGDIRDVRDLAGKRVGTVQGTTAEKYLARVNLKPAGYANIDAALAALRAGELDAVVYDAPVLKYMVAREAAGDIRLVGEVFATQYYGLGLQPVSPLRKPLNEEMLRLSEEGFFQGLRARWFGED